jgi:hydroxymethylpyrimidine kinase/phosphomethylpyrimidine kinase
MLHRKQFAVALTVAGSDSGGGAGIQADLKTFAALGVHGTTVLTCVTAQNPRRITGLQPVRPDIVRRQLQAIFAELPPAAVKTGMLFSAGIVRAVVRELGKNPRRPLVVDPVNVSTSGTRLLSATALRRLQSELLPLATLVTPNIPEAELLLNMRIRSEKTMRAAARAIHERWGCAALVKGGHLTSAGEAADIFFDGKTELLLTAPRVKGVKTHGTGCVYSAAIAAQVAKGFSLVEAVTEAKQFVTQAIAESIRAGRHDVLNTSART